MKWNVLTPFSRTQNLIELGNRIKEEGAFWHLLSIEGEYKLPDLGTWTRQYFFDPPPKDFFVGHWLCNRFLDSVEVEDDSYYVVLTDDDGLEPGFFKKLEPYDDDIIIVSMKRSNKPTGTDAGCPFGSLIAAPENMKVCYAGYEQAVIKGKVAKQYRCGGVYHADGLLLEKLFAERMESFRFVPDAFVYFNRYPPGYNGRWNR